MRFRTDGLDLACTLPGLHAGCINRATDLNDAAFAAVEQDLALLVLAQRLRLNRTRVVDDRAHHVAGLLCRHDDVAAVGFQDAAVERAGFRERAVNRKVKLARRIGRQVDILCCGQSNLAAFVRDRAAVLDGRCMQCHEAAFGADRTFIDDFRRGIVSELQIERAVAIAEGFHLAVAHPCSGGHERTNVNGSVLTEQDAIGIDDEYVSIGCEAAVNERLCVTGHAVECNRSSVRLVKANAFIVVDIEALPVNGEVLRILVYRHLFVLARDFAMTRADCFALRHGIRHTTERHGHHGRCESSRFAMPCSSYLACHDGSPLSFLLSDMPPFQKIAMIQKRCCPA